MMRIQWHTQQRQVFTPSFVGYIRTGESTSVKNWRTALRITRRSHIWDEAWAELETIAASGRDVTAGVPEVERFEIDGKELAVVFGVVAKGITPKGRTEGEYKFILCDGDEILLVLAHEFRFKQRLARR